MGAKLRLGLHGFSVGHIMTRILRYYGLILQLCTFISKAVKHGLTSYTIVTCNVHFPPFYYGRLGQNNLGRPSQSTKPGELVLG